MPWKYTKVRVGTHYKVLSNHKCSAFMAKHKMMVNSSWLKQRLSVKDRHLLQEYAFLVWDTGPVLTNSTTGRNQQMTKGQWPRWLTSCQWPRRLTSSQWPRRLTSSQWSNRLTSSQRPRRLTSCQQSRRLTSTVWIILPGQ